MFRKINYLFGYQQIMCFDRKMPGHQCKRTLSRKRHSVTLKTPCRPHHPGISWNHNPRYLNPTNSLQTSWLHKSQSKKSKSNRFSIRTGKRMFCSPMISAVPTQWCGCQAMNKSIALCARKSSWIQYRPSTQNDFFWQNYPNWKRNLSSRFFRLFGMMCQSCLSMSLNCQQVMDDQLYIFNIAYIFIRLAPPSLYYLYTYIF